MVSVRNLFFGLLVGGLMLSGCSQDSTVEKVNSDTTLSATSLTSANATTIPLKEANISKFVLKYNVGDVHQYRVTQSTELVQDTIVVQENSTRTYTKRVKRVLADGSFEVGFTFDSIKVVRSTKKISGDVLESVTYSSADSAQKKSPDFKQFAAILGTEVNITYTTDGKVQEISGVNAIVNTLLKDFPQQVSDQQKAQLAAQIENTVYSVYAQQEMLTYPTSAIDSAGQWHFEQSSPIGSGLVTSNKVNYKIASVKSINNRKVAMVEGIMQGEISAMPIPKGTPLTIKVLNSEVSGSTSSAIDINSGTTIRKQHEVKIQATVQATSTQNNQKQTIQQKNIMRYKVERIK